MSFTLRPDGPKITMRWVEKVTRYARSRTHVLPCVRVGLHPVTHGVSQLMRTVPTHEPPKSYLVMLWRGHEPASSLTLTLSNTRT